MDRSKEEAGSSAVVPVPSDRAHFSNIATFPTANNPTQPKKKEIEKFYSKYQIPRGAYHHYHAKEKDRVSHIPLVPQDFSDYVVGITEATFKCGFRATYSNS